jgi:hypothetical protein
MSHWWHFMDDVKKMIVELQQGQSANPNQCGSCFYFKRMGEGNYSVGRCQFKFPPQLTKYTNRIDANTEDSIPANQVNDDYNCSLYKSAGNEYHQVKIWKA